MINYLVSHTTELKLTLAASVGLVAWLADASQQLNIQGWEEVGLKGILLAATLFVGRLFLEARKSHKAEMKDTLETHKKDAEVREAKLQQCIAENTHVLQELSSLTQEQTDYFKTVTRVIVEEKLKQSRGA